MNAPSIAYTAPNRGVTAEADGHCAQMLDAVEIVKRALSGGFVRPESRDRAIQALMKVEAKARDARRAMRQEARQ